MNTYRTIDQWRDLNEGKAPPLPTDFAHAKAVSIPYGELENVLDWCRHQCQMDWAWSMVSTGTSVNQYVFYFHSDQDCMAFVLTWC